MGNKVHFLPVKHKSSLQVDRCQSFQVYIVRHTQSTQNNKFAISLQYLKEKIKEEVSADKVCAIRYAQITQNNKFRSI